VSRSPRLQIVPPDSPPPPDFATALRAACEKIIASGATSAAVMYETPDAIAVAAVPPSQCLAYGLAVHIAASLSPGEGE